VGSAPGMLPAVTPPTPLSPSAPAQRPPRFNGCGALPEREIAEQTGAFATDQFNNTDMVGGYLRMGSELLDQLPGPPPLSAFCAYVGTAGCFLGVSRALAAKLPGTHRAVVEPGESAVLSGRPAGTLRTIS
jgi:cysteine synthase